MELLERQKDVNMKWNKFEYASYIKLKGADFKCLVNNHCRFFGLKVLVEIQKNVLKGPISKWELLSLNWFLAGFFKDT